MPARPLTACTELISTIPDARAGAEGHVGIWPVLREHALLAMPAGKLVPNDRVPGYSHLDGCLLQIPLLGSDDGHLVYHAHLLPFQLPALARL